MPRNARAEKGGTADKERNIRSFAAKLYTERGNRDLVGIDSQKFKWFHKNNSEGTWNTIGGKHGREG